MKNILLILALCLCTLTANAQKDKATRKVLDNTARILTSKGGIKATFKAESFLNGNSQGSASGTMCIQNNKYQMTTPDMITWYNGETQWSYIKANEEVNVTVPTVEEQQSMNPYTFIHLYKKGYNYTMKETTLRGKKCHEVTLSAENKNNKIRTILIDIEKSSGEPLCIRMQQSDGTWTRISIYNFSANQKFTAADFEFNSSDYPQAEVIDLR